MNVTHSTPPDVLFNGQKTPTETVYSTTKKVFSPEDTIGKRLISPEIVSAHMRAFEINIYLDIIGLVTPSKTQTLLSGSCLGEMKSNCRFSMLQMGEQPVISGKREQQCKKNIWSD